jgi:glycosyltransferase involved in cell wall biosynthesis
VASALNTPLDAPPARACIRMLYFVRESFPTFRPDIEVLFGQQLISRGHQIDLVMQAGSDAEAIGPHTWHGRTVWVGKTDARDGYLHRLRKQWLALRHDLRALRGVHRGGYQAVQIRDKFIIAAVAAFLARRRGVRFFYWLSFPEPESHLLRVRERTARYPIATWVRGMLFHWLLYRLILPRCDHAFVQSEQMRQDIAAHGIDPDKLTPVPMGVAASDVRSATAGPPQSPVPTATLTLAYLGTLNLQRRLEVLIEMLALLRAAGHAARLVFIGGGDDADDQPRLERRAAELGISDHVEITGFLPRATALARVQSVDIALSPFYPTPVLRSTSPTKLVEYLALGVPVVANDHPEQRLVLHESGAGVCVPWGARYFARGVAWLASRGPVERQRMGEQGRRWVLAHRTYERIAAELEQKYLQLLGAPLRTGGETT